MRFLLILSRLCVWPSYLGSGIHFLVEYLANGRILFGRPLAWHFFSSLFSGEISSYFLPCSTVSFILCEQYNLSWRISVVDWPDGHGEGSRVLLEHLQSAVLRRASVTVIKYNVAESSFVLHFSSG